MLRAQHDTLSLAMRSAHSLFSVRIPSACARPLGLRTRDAAATRAGLACLTNRCVAIRERRAIQAQRAQHARSPAPGSTCVRRPARYAA